MVKYQKIKLEFTSNTSQTINIDSHSDNIICAAKAAGKIGNDFFTAMYKFNIDTKSSSITNIHFINVTNVNNTNIIDNMLEQTVYTNLSAMLTLSTINGQDITLINTSIDYLVLYIKLGYDNIDNFDNFDNFDNIDNIDNIDSSSHAKHKILLDTLSQPKNEKLSSDKSSFSSSSESKTSHSIILKSKKNKKPSENILKLVAWSAMMSFILHIFKSIKHKDK
jgi:hypothetical protein